jgi:hypothetical protein
VGYTLGLSYQHERVKITPWISYQRLGATDVSSTRTPMAHFGQSSATAVGVKLGYSFE